MCGNFGQMVCDAVGAHTSRMLPIAAFPKLRTRSCRPERESGDGLVFPDRLPTIKEMVQLLVEEAVRRAHGNQAQAASLVGITPQGDEQATAAHPTRPSRYGAGVALGSHLAGPSTNMLFG